MSFAAVWLIPVLVLLFSTCILPYTQADPVLTTIATLPINGIRALTVDADGNLFGTSVAIPPAVSTIIEITKGSHTAITLASIPHVLLLGNLALDSAGNIFGTADAGDLKSSSVFELAKGSHTVKTLALVRDFSSTDIAVDKEGNVFWAVGSELTKGRIFKIVNGSHALMPLATFPTSCPGNISFDDAGNCFCITVGEIGKVVEIAKGGQVITLVSFHNNVPWYCRADTAGNLFVMTSATKSNFSTIFEIVKCRHSATPLATLPHVMSAYLVLSSTGDIFATTFSLKSGEFGTIVKLVSGSHKATTIATFRDTTPGIILDTSGNLFGTTPKTPIIDPNKNKYGFHTYRGSTPCTVFEIAAP